MGAIAARTCFCMYAVTVDEVHQATVYCLVLGAIRKISVPRNNRRSLFPLILLATSPLGPRIDDDGMDSIEQLERMVPGLIS
jgi:hypothetical protein